MGKVQQAAIDGGFGSPSDFIRAAINHELTGRESGLNEAERRMAASLDRVARELRSIRLRQQAEFAFLDALVKTMLTHLTELPRDTYEQAVARGKLRYERFLKSVGMGMNGDSQAAITELMKRVEED
jgi:Arc/MetJ-type ribon-helix-helix transcriptional regulator